MTILSDRASQFRASGRGGEANYPWYAHGLGIKLLYDQKPQCKGKIEGLFHFVQRDFVLEIVNQQSIRQVNEAFIR